jgi:hypothetical protein
MIKKTITALVVLVAFSSCSEKESTKNLQITGNIEGFKKGTLYIQKVQDTVLVPLDTIKIDGDSHFTAELDIDSPEMLYLFIDRGVTNSIDNNLPFFAEPGKINIETTLSFFSSASKITGSKNQELYDEYKYVVSKYTDQDLDLIKKRFETKNEAELEKITKQQESLLKRKYLYTTNFAVNHSDYDVAPYLAVSEIYNINLKYLDTIDKSMTPNVAKSLYGKQLKQLIAERKKTEK